MRAVIRLIPLVLLTALALSCASTKQLAQRGDIALNAGDNEKAFDWARRALDRDGGNAHARDVMTRAGNGMITARWNQIRAMAETDTVGAARRCLELDDFRARAARYRVTLARDPDFESLAARVRTAAAGIYYDQGNASLASHRPKRACSELTEAARFTPGFRDVEARLARAREEAVTRVAILPLNNEVSVPGLSRALAHGMGEMISMRIDPNFDRFTRIVPQARIDERITVAQVGHLSAEEAVRLGREIGAQRIVIGRVHDMRVNTDNNAYHETLFHRSVEKDIKGREHERYAEERFDAVARVRTVTVVCDFEVLETDEGSVLARHSEEKTAIAHTVFSRFSPSGNCNDYCLVPPNLKDSDRGRTVDREWRRTFGSWTLPALLERARKDAGRTRYQPQFRSEFSSSGTSTPVWLDDLPPEEDLAMIALGDAWFPVLKALRELDGKDDVDAVLEHDGH